MRRRVRKASERAVFEVGGGADTERSLPSGKRGPKTRPTRGSKKEKEGKEIGASA
jgi:hypothetical protein